MRAATLNTRRMSLRRADAHTYGMHDFLGDIEVLRFGLSTSSNGEEVKQLQEMLIKTGYSVGSKGADGFFGDGTLQAVYKWQRNNGRPEMNFVGNGMWTALRQSSGYASGGAPQAPATQPAAQAVPAPVPPPQATSAPQAPLSSGRAPVATPPRSTPPPVMQPTQAPIQPQPTGGGFDVGKFFTDAANTVTQYAPIAQQAAGALGVQIPGLTQAQQTAAQFQQTPQQTQQTGFSPGQTTGSTPALVPSGRGQGQEQGSQTPVYAPQGGNAPQSRPTPDNKETVFIEVEPPLQTIARFAIPAGLGVGTTFGLQAAQAKPNLIVSIIGGLGIAVGSYFIGEKLFPFTPSVMQQQP